MSRAGSLARAFGSDGALNIGDIGNVAATAVPYSNAVSGISANTVQEAIDYLNTLSSGGAGDVASYTRQKFTATAGQTTFTVTAGYTVGYLQVFMNGILLDVSDYAASDGSTVVLTAAAAANDEIVTIALDSFNIAELLRVTNISASAATDALTLDSTSILNGRFRSKTARTVDGVLVEATNATTKYGVSIGSNTNDDALEITRRHPDGDRVQWGVDYYGFVKAPFQPAFYAYSASAGIGSGFTSGTVMTFNTVITNIGSGYNSSSGRFTAPTSGTYALSASVSFGNASAENYWVAIRLRRNGSVIGSDNYALGHVATSFNNAYDCVSHSAVLTLNAGDYIDIATFFNTFNGNVQFGHFSGHLIG